MPGTRASATLVSRFPIRPLHHVTYVRVYDWTAQVVYVASLDDEWAGRFSGSERMNAFRSNSGEMGGRFGRGGFRDSGEGGPVIRRGHAGPHRVTRAR